MKNLYENKKGQLGMNVAKGFMLGLMSLLVIGVTALIIINSLNDTTFALDKSTVANETGIYLNGTTYTVDSATRPYFTSFVITSVIDSNTNVTLASGNYTAGSTGTIVNASDDANASAMHYISYTFSSGNEIASVTDNSSDGVVDFFSNSTTWLALVGIVIIILIISVVISVVNRFGGGRDAI